MKGYGDTHARGLAAFDAIHGDFAAPALNGEARPTHTIAEARLRGLSDRSA